MRLVPATLIGSGIMVHGYTSIYYSIYQVEPRLGIDIRIYTRNIDLTYS
jgi:hypothetical protein